MNDNKLIFLGLIISLHQDTHPPCMYMIQDNADENNGNLYI